MHLHLTKSAMMTTVAVALALTACSPSGPSNGATTTTPPTATTDTAPAAEGASKTTAIEAPPGRYEVDRAHTTLAFSVNHLGLSNYVARFTDYEITLDLVPGRLDDSAVDVSIDPTSVRTDYVGDYSAGHPNSGFESWNEDLAQSEHFFNAGEYPRIRFTSRRVEEAGPGELRVHGDLTLRGRTRPVTLDVELVGSAANHPAQPDGGGAIGFSATGEFARSGFGMDHLLNPPLVGDTVTLRFEGEFVQVGDATGSLHK